MALSGASRAEFIANGVAAGKVFQPDSPNLPVLMDHTIPTEAHSPTTTNDALGSERGVRTLVPVPTHHASSRAVKTAPAAKTEEPIIFYDPLGARWGLPFEKAKTWEGMKALVVSIFNSGIGHHGWYRDCFITSDEQNRRSFCLTRLPQQVDILPEVWNEMVQPGWQIKITFEGHPRFVQKALHAMANETATEKQGSVEEEPYNHVPNELQDISYVARLFQQDGTTYPSYLRQKTYKEPLLSRVLDSTSELGSVLCEVRNIFLGISKTGVSNSEDYDSLQSDDVFGVPVLQIHSSILLDALKAVMHFQTSVEIEDDEGFSMVTRRLSSNLRSGQFVFPFEDLYYHKEDLSTYRTQVGGPKQHHSREYNETCDRHIQILLDYLYNQPAIQLGKAETAWSQSLPMTAFRSLWILLKPGSDVYVRERGRLNAYVVERVEGIVRTTTSPPRPYLVKLWNLDFNGKCLSRSVKTVSIPVFDGEREVTSLPVFPTRFHRDKANERPHREVLIERGKTFVKVITQPSYQEYTGPSSFSRARTYSQARVMVDHTDRPWEKDVAADQPNRHMPNIDSGEELGLDVRVPKCGCKVCAATTDALELSNRTLAFEDYDDISLDSVDSLTEHQYFLCFSHVYAYALQDRCWELVDVQGLKNPTIERTIINTLVIKPEKNKSMIKAICETYHRKEHREQLFFADPIKGKGEGLIILLHGPPGTGKTLTAESVAEFLQRPLLTITGSDLCDEPEQLERNLIRFLRNATKWNAIVLLDEADVYLERRSANDLRRNSIVSIFLRALDYFQGILFLTTNRVGTFDEAFMSRIHIQVGFEPLDDESRKQIWTNSFQKLAENHLRGGREILYTWPAKEFVMESEKVRWLQWNGREIRNAFQTAVTLACYEAKQEGDSIPKVTENHFSQVVDMSTNFKRYMRSAHQNADYSDLAYWDRLRDDRFRLAQMKGAD